MCMIELGDNAAVTDDELACAHNCTHVTLVDELIGYIIKTESGEMINL